MVFASPLKVVLVEDDGPTRKVLSKVIANEPSIQLVKEFSDAEAALAEISELRPHVVIMDIHLPGKNGIECTRELRKLCPSAEVLVLTAFSDSKQLMSAIKAGACGYLLKRATPDQIIQAIFSVAEGGAPMSAGIARQILDTLREPPPARTDELQCLSPRELEVLDLIAKGYATKEIADSLDVTVTTTKWHIKNIYRKLHVRSRTEILVKIMK